MKLASDGMEMAQRHHRIGMGYKLGLGWAAALPLLAYA